MINFNFLANVVFVSFFFMFNVCFANAVCPSPNKIYKAMKKMPKGHLEFGSIVLGYKVVKTRLPDDLITGRKAYPLLRGKYMLNIPEMAFYGLNFLIESDCKRVCSYKIDRKGPVSFFILID